MFRHVERVFICVTFTLLFLSCSSNPTSSPIGTGTTGNIPKNSNGEIVYVAIGNSLTAGMQASGITSYTAHNSFPVLLAKQLGLTESKFTFPDWTVGSGADTYANDDKRYRKKLIGYNSDNQPIIGKEVANDLLPLNYFDELPYHNLGIPGAYSFDITDTTELIVKSQKRPNPYFFQVLRNQEIGKNVIQQAKKLSPTLVTFWVGNNDILFYALSGATSKALPNEQVVGPTPVNEFEMYYSQSLRKILSELPQAVVIVMNLPDILFAPYFTRQPKGLTLTLQEADSLNTLALQEGKEQRFREGFNSFVVSTKSGIRQATLNDCILDKEFMLGNKMNGMIVPLSDDYVLDENEISEIKQTIKQYNTIIENTIAQEQRNHPEQKRIVMVDMYTLLKNIGEKGYPVSDGSLLTTEFVKGGLFSIDGIHPTSRGYGVLANEIIMQALNRELGADIPLIPLTELKTVFTE